MVKTLWSLRKSVSVFFGKTQSNSKKLLADAERMDEFVKNAREEICKLSNKEIIALSKIIDEAKIKFDIEYN